MLERKTVIEVTSSFRRTVQIEFDFRAKPNSFLADLYSISPKTELKKNESIPELEIPLTLNHNGFVYTVDTIEGDLFNISWDKKNLIGIKEHPIGKLVIASGIKNILNDSFYGIYADTVVWPHSCTFLRADTFYSANIKHFEGLEQVRVIGDSCFRGNQALESFDWPQSCTTVPTYCFSSCNHLSKITGLENVTSIDRSAFAHTKLTEFVWPEKCREISDYCFDCCESLEKLEINGPVTSVGVSAIRNTKIEELDLSNSLQCNVAPDFADEGRDVKLVLPFYSV
jgi:hypothetical protein